MVVSVRGPDDNRKKAVGKTIKCVRTNRDCKTFRSRPFPRPPLSVIANPSAFSSHLKSLVVTYLTIIPLLDSKRHDGKKVVLHAKILLRVFQCGVQCKMQRCTNLPKTFCCETQNRPYHFYVQYTVGTTVLDRATWSERYLWEANTPLLPPCAMQKDSSSRNKGYTTLVRSRVVIRLRTNTAYVPHRAVYSG